MLVFLLSKRRPSSAILPFFASHRCFSATAIQNPDPETSKSPKFSIVDYLVASLGFSPDEAAKISKRIAHLKSPEKPDSVLRFLNQHGFAETDIKALVASDPRILRINLEKTLEPNLSALRGIALSTSALTSILLSNPDTIRRRSAVPRINFWKDFLGGNEADLVKAFKDTNHLISLNIAENIEPKISLFRSHGLSTSDIRRIVLTSRLITNSVSTIEDTLKRTKELGFQPESGMFLKGLLAMESISRDMLRKKMELFKGFGWSEDEFLLAVWRAPRWVLLSEKNLQMKMDYLLGEARCDASYIATRPLLLSLSLEKRLRPRQHVLCQLESNGLYSKPQDQKESTSKRQDYWSVMCMTDVKFVERYILPNKEIISGLHEAYLAACGIQSTNSFKDVQV